MSKLRANESCEALGSCENPAYRDGHVMKYVVVTGGTLSGLGKGTTISSIGVVLKTMGLRVTSIKIDPYLNVDAGTMSPYEHGEVYVLEDGGEVDLDLGNYERFLNITLTKDHNITSGKIYEKVIRRERKGEYLGKTVQVVPHVTNAIQNWIKSVAFRSVDKCSGAPDICLIEVGGTVGDIESAVYLEALQQFFCKAGEDNFCLCHVSYVPIVCGEPKTKPTQHSVKELRQAGLRPDFLFCRSELPINESARAKIALFSQVPHSHVISVHNVSNVYRVPMLIEEQSFGELVCRVRKLGLVAPSPSPESPPASLQDPTFSMSRWESLADKADSASNPVRIGIVGKYTGFGDSYLSVVKALHHAAVEADLKLDIVWIESTDLEQQNTKTTPAMYREAVAKLESVDGVLCPGGFGDRGICGLEAAAEYCRTHSVPFFGICLGMQIAIIEFCRNVLGLEDANSEEFDPHSQHKVVVFMPEVNADIMGGTMRLGNRATIIRDKKSVAYKLYDQQPVIYERHRHRYEVNLDFVPAIEAHGLKFTGQDERGQRMEIAELQGHPFYFAVQYHPEFTSRPIKPNPCFLGFILAAKSRLSARFEEHSGRLRAGSTYLEKPLNDENSHVEATK
ncbi:CTP synthase-like [Condylostylus longicornis]|uniref:CTP synthase-like n=1 Tax=Condylostylus longicornis TaxID=2530218 RepID=UPI00244DF618|nr:CTP synthase-like [Condylostylus longicornis]